MRTSCLLSIAQLLEEREMEKRARMEHGHLVVVARPQIDHDVLVPANDEQIAGDRGVRRTGKRT